MAARRPSRQVVGEVEGPGGGGGHAGDIRVDFVLTTTCNKAPKEKAWPCPLIRPSTKNPRLARRVRVDIVGCGVVALAAAGLAGLAWTRPATTASVLRYVQSGSLSYAATVPVVRSTAVVGCKPESPFTQTL